MTADEFFHELQQYADKDTAVVANLRRSASYDPGQYPPVFRYVEPYVHKLGEWERCATYMAAAYWALASRRGRQEGESQTVQEPHSLPKAVQVLQALVANANNSSARSNIENRFQALLDADTDELQWRLRHLINQLAAAGIAIDWPSLLQDLRKWPYADRRVQIRWARQFWSASEAKGKSVPVDGDTVTSPAKAKGPR
jgi:CRISPR system Cascade subunit CasB